MVAGQWLTVQDVAELLQVRIETVRRWVRRGELPVLELGGARSVYRIRPDDLDRFVWQRYRSLGDEALSDLDETAVDSHSGSTELQSERRAYASDDGTYDPDLHVVVDRIPTVTFREDASQPGYLLYISNEIESLLGYSLSDWQDHSRSWLEFVHPHDRGALDAEFARTDSTGEPFSMDYRMMARDGRVVWIHCEAILTHNESLGSPVWEGTLVDVTQRKAIEETLGIRARQQRAVAELGQHALNGADLNNLLKEAVAYASRALDVEYAKVFEVLPGGDSFVLRAAVGWQENHIGEISVPSGEIGMNIVPSRADSQAGFTLVANEAVVAGDLASETRFDGPRMVAEYGVRSGASVIIPGRGRPFGVIGVHSTRLRSFSREDVLFLQSVANVVASVVARTDMSWLTVTDVADSLQVTEETVRRWIRRSELPALNLGGPRAGYRVYPSDLQRFIGDRLIGI